MRRMTCAAIVALLPALFSAVAYPQDFPGRPLRLLIPYAPGGGPDTVGRGLTAGMTKNLGQTVVIDNKPGGAGVTAILDLKNSPADGYTLFLPDNGNWGTFPALRVDAPYDPVRDFAPIGMVYANNVFFYVAGNSPLKTMADLVARAKEKPGTLKYGHNAVGGIFHLIGEAFRISTGLETIAVPYKNSAANVVAVMGGELDFAISGLSSIKSLAQSGRIRILATAFSKRDRYEPDVPSMLEAIGLKNYSFRAEIGLVAAAGTPRPIVDRLARSLREAQKDTPYLDALRKLEYEAASATPEEFGKIIRNDLERFRAVAKAANMKAEY